MCGVLYFCLAYIYAILYNTALSVKKLVALMMMMMTADHDGFLCSLSKSIALYGLMIHFLVMFSLMCMLHGRSIYLQN